MSFGTPAEQDHGMAHLCSRHSHAETVARLEVLLGEKRIPIFCRVDHSGGAAEVGLTMLPSLLLIFGHPKGGTPLMIEAPTLALDLPYKALIREDEQGAVWLSYNKVSYLRDRHQLHSEAAALVGLESLLQQAAGV